MSKTMSFGLLCRLGVASAVLMALASVTGVARADKVGVAAAVNPDAFSSLSGAPQTQLNIGKSIFYNERINTTSSGLVQVLLVDGSTFTVGPGSDLVIDKFVYDPKKNSGQIAASLTKGVMRFVGGKISKNADSVTVDTPAGGLAIRGGMFDLKVNGTKLVAVFTYGIELKLTHGGVETVAFQPGWVIDTTTGSTTVRQATAADTNSFMAALTNKGGNNGTTGGPNGTTGDGPKPGQKYTEVQTLSLQQLISDATSQQINNQINDDEKNDAETADAAPDKGTPTDTPTDNPTPPGDTDNPPPPGPTQVTARVLLSPGVYTAFPGTPDEFTTGDPGSSGILGGDPRSTGNDFIQTFSIVDGRLVGTVSGLTEAHCNDQDCSEIEIHTPPPADVSFPATFTADTSSPCIQFGVCAVTDGTVTQNGQTKTYVGLAVLKQDFFAYQLIGVPNTTQDSEDNGPNSDPVLVFGSKGYDFGAPSGKTYAFILTPDIKESAHGGAIGPFAGANSSPVVNPDGPQPSVSPLLYLEKDSASPTDPSHAVWLQTGLYINTIP
jgi:hypothetical protein